MKNDYIIEFIQHGGSIKVSAIDPVTLTEVSMVGDARAGKEDLAQLAARKLEYVLAKKKLPAS